MFASLRHPLARLLRWPRRIAAIACLVFAAAATLTPAAGNSAQRARTTAELLHRGEVALSVEVASTPLDLRRGDRIGLLAGPDDSGAGAPAAMLADRLRLLAAPTMSASGSDPPIVLVAAGRDAALRIAANSGRSVLVVVDKSP